jgi:hypothetical protein
MILAGNFSACHGAECHRQKLFATFFSTRDFCGHKPTPIIVSENHSNIRDEQFWFTAAVVGFNTLIISKDTDALPVCFLIIVSGLISLFGVHLILTRWLVASGRSKLDPNFDNKTATAGQRIIYAWSEILSYIRNFPYVIAELSGSLFYLLLIVLTFIGVVCRVLN